jgi:glycerol-3-phosphate O-acyltransferase
LDIYKNNICHLFVKEAILAAAVRANLEEGSVEVELVRKEASFLSDTLKYEFVYNPKLTFDEQFDRTLSIFIDSGLLEMAPSSLGDEAKTRVQVPEGAKETLSLCHRILEPWIEGYWMMVTAVDGELGQATPEKEFIKRVQKLAQRRYQEGDLSCPEAVSSIPLKNSISLLTEKKLLQRTPMRRDQLLSFGEASAGEPGQLTELANRLRKYFCV